MEHKTIAMLMLGGAKRVAMARLFRRAAAELGCELKLYSYELSPCEAIAAEAEVIVGLRWSDPKVYTDLQQVAARHGISIVVPFVDGAIEVAARFRDLCPGIFVPTGSAESAAMCLDKLALAQAFEKAALPQPKLYAADASALALIAKPRKGSASKGLKVIDFAEMVGNASDCIVQQYIADRTEYSVDCYVSVRSGRLLAAGVRRRIEVVGGEVIDTETIDAPEVRALAAEAIERLGLRGAVTVQLLRDNTDGRLYLMEINPRLGGGAVCSVEAGADLPGCILREALGMPEVEFSASPGVRLKRFMDGVVFKNQNQ